MSISELLRSELAGLVARHVIEVKRIKRIKAEHGDALSPGLSDCYGWIRRRRARRNCRIPPIGTRDYNEFGRW